MSKTKVFVSFDFDNDKKLEEFIIGQSKNSDSPFQVADWSMKEAVSQRNWEDEVESRIKRSDLVLVMVGSKTHKAPGVLKEVEIARQNNIRIIQVIGYKDGNYTAVPNAGRLHSWNWDNLAEDEAKNLDNGLYVYHDDEKHGPYSENEIIQRIKNETFPQDILVWRDGMDERRPFLSVIQFPGIGRLVFFALFILISIIGVVALLVMRNERYIKVISLFLMVALIVPAIPRLKNIGRNPAWSLLVLIPIVGLLVTVPCLILPEGYGLTKKLDMAGKIIVSVIFASTLIAVLLSIIYFNR